MRFRAAVAMLVCFAMLGVGRGAGRALTQSGQTAVSGAGATETQVRTPEQIAARDAMLQPGDERMKARDGRGALEAYRPALAAYPTDAVVLRSCADAAALAHQPEEALGLFERALAQHPAQAWPMRLAVLELNAQMGRWDAFDRGLLELRAAKTSKTDHALDGSEGFVIEHFEAGGRQVQAIVYPSLSGRFHTLYRFVLPKGAVPTAPAQASAHGSGPASPCVNPEFRPYFNVESDDIDQASFAKAHPDLAAKGGRSYSLDRYPAPCSQALMRFYADGEPRYEDVRADVLRALQPAPEAVPAH